MGARKSPHVYKLMEQIHCYFLNSVLELKGVYSYSIFMEVNMKPDTKKLYFVQLFGSIVFMFSMEWYICNGQPLEVVQLIIQGQI